MILCALSKLYSKSLKVIQQQEEDSEMDTADLIDAGISKEATFQSEGTVVFHLVHAIRMGHPIERDVLKLLKSGAQLPQVVTQNRFVLFVSLAMASVKKHRATVAEAIKAAACKSITLKMKASAHGWLRQTLPEWSEVSVAFEGLIV